MQPRMRSYKKSTAASKIFLRKCYECPTVHASAMQKHVHNQIPALPSSSNVLKADTATTVSGGCEGSFFVGQPATLFRRSDLVAFVKRGSPVQSRGAAPKGKPGVSAGNPVEPHPAENSDEGGELLGAIARQVSRLAWSADLEDLKQEALLTALDLDRRKRWREAENPIGYVATVVRNRLLDMATAERCPVNVGVGSGTGGRRAAYDERVAAALTDVRSNFDALLAGGFPSPEDDIDRARALAELRRVVASQPPAARAVILDGEKPTDVAKATGLTAKQVYWQVEHARDLVRARLLAMVGGRR